MLHVGLFLYLVAFTTGVSAITMVGYYYYKHGRSKTIKLLLSADIFFLTVFLFDSFNYYSNLFTPINPVPAWVSVLIINGMLFAAILKSYCEIRVTFAITGRDPFKRFKIVFIIFSLLSVMINLLLLILYSKHTITDFIAGHTGFFTSNLFCFFSDLYCLYYLKRNWKTIRSDVKPLLKKLMLATLVISPLSVFFNVIGYWGIKLPFPLSFSPIGLFLLNAFGVCYLAGILFSAPGSPPQAIIKQNFQYGNLSRYNLTQRERELVKHLADGLSNQEIGNLLYISPNTVKNHITNIYRKIGIGNRIELINILLQQGSHNDSQKG